MRLNPQEVNIIHKSVEQMDPSAEIYLFGSRVNDSAKGGDIDLLVESQQIDSKKKRDLRELLIHQLGDQKVDLFVTADYSEPFARIAKSKGIRL